MEANGVLVVGETPSLGRSIADLLESEDVPTRYVHDLAAEEPLAELGSRYRSSSWPVAVTFARPPVAGYAAKCPE